MLKLYNFELSAECYKARLLLTLLNLVYERVPVNVHPGVEQDGEAFRRVDRWGRLPVLDDAGFRIGGALPVMTYLARQYGAHTRWLPTNARLRARIDEWLLASQALAASAGAARAHLAFGADCDLEPCQDQARLWFAIAEEHLADGEIEGRNFLAGDQVTLADLACFPDSALAQEAGLTLNPYPALRRWRQRVKAVPGFIGMPGIFALGVDPPSA